MRKTLKLSMVAIAWCVAQVARIFRRTPQVVVLMYHAIDRSGWKLSVTPETFERQMSYLARKGWAVPLADVVSYAKEEKKLHAHAVAVTFDDGYRDLFTTVLPILERYKIHATVFVPSDLSVRTDPEDRLRLTEEELKKLAQSPFITIGSHAHTHRKFTELSQGEMQNESKESAGTLERILGERPRFFAYPFGARSSDAEHAVKDAGYEAAFGITEGTIRQGDNLFRLKRVQIDSTMNHLLFRLRLTSAVDWNRRIVDSLRVRGIGLKRLRVFFTRIFHGEDVVLVSRTKEQWDSQFTDGKWDRLQEGQSNTIEIARLVSDYARESGKTIRVLDVGCGNGGLARLIAGDPSIDYTGIDVSEAAVARAREVSPQGTFIVGDAMNPPENLGVFDVLVFSELLYYLDPRIVLPHYRTHANAGAQIYISIIRFWRSWFLWRRIKQHLLIAKRFVVKDASHRWDIAIGTYS